MTRCSIFDDDDNHNGGDHDVSSLLYQCYNLICNFQNNFCDFSSLLASVNIVVFFSFIFEQNWKTCMPEVCRFKCHTFRNPFLLCVCCVNVVCIYEHRIRLAHMVDHLSVSVRCCFCLCLCCCWFTFSLYFFPLFCMICFNKYFISSTVVRSQKKYGLRFHSPFCLCICVFVLFVCYFFFLFSLTTLLNYGITQHINV